ncbi:MAG: hypothetical protein K2X68_01195 [Novosphingobium sp.]|nr:hypothetical protein [Novosphingobium sp.]
MTDAATMQLGKLAAPEPGVGLWYFQWGNRSNAPLYNRAGKLVPRKLNFQPASGKLRRQRSPFTSIERANACTLAQTAHLLDEDAKGTAIAQQAGLSLVAESEYPDLGAAGPFDLCVIATSRLPHHATGIFLDYEVADGRTPAQSLDFLRRFAALVHGAGRKVGVMINPLDAPTQAWTGITGPVAQELTAVFEYTTIWLWARNAQGSLPLSYTKQMELLRQAGAVDGKRVLALFELAGTSEDDARFVHDAVRRDGLAGVMLWRNQAVQGGSCDSPVNRKTALLLFGQLPGADPKRSPKALL